MNAQLAAIRAAAAARYKSHRASTSSSASAAPSSTSSSASSTNKRRKASTPVRNLGATIATTSNAERKEGEEEESFVAKEFKKQKLASAEAEAKSIRFREKEREKYVVELLHDGRTSSGSKGLTNLLDRQGHLDSRRSAKVQSAFLGGPVEAAVEEEFLSGSKRMAKYHLRQEETSSKKKVIVARYYRSTGSRKLLEEPSVLLSKDRCIEVLSEAVKRSGTRRRQADPAKIVTSERLMRNSPTLFWNVVYHYEDVSKVIPDLRRRLKDDNADDRVGQTET